MAMYEDIPLLRKRTSVYLEVKAQDVYNLPSGALGGKKIQREREQMIKQIG